MLERVDEVKKYQLVGNQIKLSCFPVSKFSLLFAYSYGNRLRLNCRERKWPVPTLYAAHSFVVVFEYAGLLSLTYPD